MELENQTLRRVTIRLEPFLIVCYFIAYLDRVNVGFAALTMNRDLGLSQTASGVAAAGGIAVINSIGNLAGFAGSYAMGAIKDATNSYQGGLFLLAALALIAMVIVLMLRHDRHLEAAPVLTAAAAE